MSVKDINWKTVTPEIIEEQIGDRIAPLGSPDGVNKEPETSWEGYNTMFVASKLARVFQMGDSTKEDLIRETERLRKKYSLPAPHTPEPAVPEGRMTLAEREAAWRKAHRDTAAADFLYYYKDQSVKKTGFKDKFFFLYSQDTGKIEHVHFGAKTDGLLVDRRGYTTDSLVDIECPAPYAQTANGRGIKHKKVALDGGGIAPDQIPRITMEMAVFNLDSANILMWSPVDGWVLYSIEFRADYFRLMMELLLHYQTKYVHGGESHPEDWFKANDHIKEKHRAFVEMSKEIANTRKQVTRNRKNARFVADSSKGQAS